GRFTDGVDSDKHKVAVNWGDGSAVQTLTSVNEVTRTFSVGHKYGRGGVFSITVIVTDNAGGVTTQNSSAVVSGVGLVNGTLYVRAEERRAGGLGRLRR